jgi:alpha-tubulin suppressor-like RCC1 family protein
MILISLLGLGCHGGTTGTAALTDAAAIADGQTTQPDVATSDLAALPPDLGSPTDLAPAVDLSAPADAPPAPSGPSPARAIAAGHTNTCVIFENGQLKCWGDNSQGQLGLGDLEPRGARPEQMGANLPVIDLGDGHTVRAVAVGAQHVCALLDGGRIKCWGENTYGQLGNLGRGRNAGGHPGEMGDELPYVDLGSERRAVSVAAGPYFTCAVLEGGQLKCWGQNLTGNLGQGDPRDRAQGELGDQLPPIDLGTGRTALAVSAAGAFKLGSPAAPGPFTGLAISCAVLDSGQVKCWGGGRINRYGALGDDGGAFDRGSRPGEMGDNMPPVRLSGQRARALAGGCSYACALVENGDVRCWGNPHMGKLGSQPFATLADPHPPVALGRPAVAIAASGATNDMDFAHTCALLDDGAVKCWGNNASGQLGLGDRNARGDEQVMGRPVVLTAAELGTGRKARAIAAGASHTCAILDRGEVKCWGLNTDGRLGLGDTEMRGAAPGQLGDKLPPVALW